MKVSLWAEIRRLHEIEGINGRGIATKLGCSRYTIGRALSMNEPPRSKPSSTRGKLIDPFRERIAKILERYPNLSAVRIREKISKPEGDSPGYQGGITQLRIHLKSIRSGKQRVYQDIRYEPGEAMQVDWGDVGPIRIGKPITRFEVEKQSLKLLPSIAYQTDELLMAEVRSTAQVEFDSNRYTVPPHLARKTVTLLAGSSTIRILHRGEQVASHTRSYGKRESIVDSQHQLAALQMRRRQGASELEANFMALGEEARAFQLALSKLPVRASVHLKRIVQLVHLYGRECVLKAMQEALHYQTIDAAYVESLVVQARRKSSLPSPTMVQPKRKELIQLELEIPDPGRYDRFTFEDDDEQNQA